MHVKCCATNQEFNSVLAIKTSHRIWNHLLHAMARSPLLLFFHLLIRPLVDRLQSRDQRSASLRQGILHGRRDRIVLFSCNKPVSLQLPQALRGRQRGGRLPGRSAVYEVSWDILTPDISAQLPGPCNVHPAIGRI